MDSSVKTYDALIIGGGAAGLSAALTLARQQHTAMVLDSEVYRNDATTKMYNVLTWDGSDPRVFRAAAKKNILDNYSTIEFTKAEVVSLEELKTPSQQCFKATGSDGATWNGRKIILATGVRDVFPEIEGYAQCWAKAIYHCFVCKGYETRGADSAGILAVQDLANPQPALYFARGALRFAKSVTIYTNGSEELSQAITEAQGENKIFKVDSRKINRLEKGAGFSDIIIHMKDGQTVTEGFLGHKPKTEPKGDLHKQLGLEMAPTGDPIAKPMFYETSRKGIFVGGDGASPAKVVAQAFLSGSSAAVAVMAQLQAEDAGQSNLF